MTPDNDHHLRFKHPVLFAQPSGPQTSCFALDGFAVGDGWGAILDALATEIERLCAIKGRPLPPVLQVKEKFGLLRIYVGKNEEDIRAAITTAEERSAVTCEVCGKPGRRRHCPGYVRTRCYRHAKVREIA